MIKLFILNSLNINSVPFTILGTLNTTTIHALMEKNWNYLRLKLPLQVGSTTMC